MTGDRSLHTELGGLLAETAEYLAAEAKLLRQAYGHAHLYPGCSPCRAVETAASRLRDAGQHLQGVADKLKEAAGGET